MKSVKPLLLVPAAYVWVALLLFVSHFFSVATNAADSGESAIPFFMLALPWVDYWPPESLAIFMKYGVVWASILLNALILFCITYFLYSIFKGAASWFGGNGAR